MKLNKEIFAVIIHNFILGIAKFAITVYFLVLRLVKNLTCWVKKQILLHKMMKTLKPYLKQNGHFSIEVTDTANDGATENVGFFK